MRLLVCWLRVVILLVLLNWLLVSRKRGGGLLVAGQRLLVDLARADFLSLNCLKRQILTIALSIAIAEVASLPGRLDEGFISLG